APETRNPKPEPRTPKPKTRNPKLETRKPRPEHPRSETSTMRSRSFPALLKAPICTRKRRVSGDLLT
ncbi:hypothetical protein T484DRAFT_1649287, partial [Baffinella frigidus]